MTKNVVVNFDARVLQGTSYKDKGIGNYAEDILYAMRSRSDIDVRILEDAALPSLKDFAAAHDVKAINSCAMSEGLYFSPSFLSHNHLPFLIAKGLGLATIAVIHDLIPLRRPAEATDFDKRTTKTGVELVNALDSIVVVSESTRRDCLEYVNDPSKMQVIRPQSRFRGMAGTFRSEADELDLPWTHRERPYIFFAVANHPRKNIQLALSSVGALLSLAYTIVIGCSLQYAIKLFGPSVVQTDRVLFSEWLSDDQLRLTYLRAALVVIPSFDEGFSLPVLEARELGCRVIASDIAAHREQIADTRLLFDPTNVDDLVLCVLYALSMVPMSLAERDFPNEFDNLFPTILALARENKRSDRKSTNQIP